MIRSMFKISLNGFLKILVVVIMAWLSNPAMSDTAVQLNVLDDQVNQIDVLFILFHYRSFGN